MFEILNTAAQKGKVAFIEDGFMTFTEKFIKTSEDEKEHVVTSTAFFAMTEKAADNLIESLASIANGRRIIVSMRKGSVEEVAFKRAGWHIASTKNMLNYWENDVVTCTS